MAAEGAVATPVVGRTAVRAVGIDSPVARLVAEVCARHRRAPPVLAGGQRVVVVAVAVWLAAAQRRAAEAVVAP